MSRAAPLSLRTSISASLLRVRENGGLALLSPPLAGLAKTSLGRCVGCGVGLGALGGLLNTLGRGLGALGRGLGALGGGTSATRPRNGAFGSSSLPTTCFFSAPEVLEGGAL